MTTRTTTTQVAGFATGPVWVRAVLWAGLVLLAGCPQTPEQADGTKPEPPELGVAITSAGLFEDCTPETAGFSDVRCQTGLRCGLVAVGQVSPFGYLTQCVPEQAATALKEGAACSFSGQSGPQVDPARRYDSCSRGLGCVEMADGATRCMKLCALRQHAGCGKSELCVRPAQVSGLGFCQKEDGCQPVAPQTGCGDGSKLSCYVLGDDKNTGTVCWPRQPYGGGGLDQACERSWHCQSGLACTTRSGREPACRPYCALPDKPDGGEVACTPGLGTCHPFDGFEKVGRCY